MLNLHQISKAFPGVRALRDVSFEVQAGEVHALCGENGAGKSTLLNILTGNLPPDTGRIEFRGKTVQFGGPAEATRLGIAIVYQQLSLVDSLSVAENIFANRQPRNRWGLIRQRALYDQTSSLLTELNIAQIQPDTWVGELSAGQKQMVEIAKALSQKPDLLLLDEPTASLTEREIRTLFELIRQLKTAGKAVVYISHRLSEIFSIADRVSVLKDGTYQGTLPVHETSADELVRRMVGRNVLLERTVSKARPEVVLAVEKLSGQRFSNVSFELHRGEILGLAGLVGAGRTELARAIFGIDGRTSGAVRLHGKPLKIRHPADAIRVGVGYLPEERKVLGLFPEQTVTQNVVVTQPSLTPAGWLDATASAARAESFRQRLDIRTPSVQTAVGTLSGGNQQKVLLARWLLTNPEVLIVDEPTHGIDVGAKADIYALLRQLAAEGKAILLISSELPELLLLADRILVMREGHLTGELPGESATEQQVMQLAMVD
ncbi:sugar ABC transporter ATP-binding protein [Larkinella sp. VNQ87]|uniref:sugar ABC transporter ATP-binding protein n=1 Tax=Larkinella sp. VNQ87 TaxID=3400921 RepID=UPI003C11122F